MHRHHNDHTPSRVDVHRDRGIPFMVKALTDSLHAQAKARGKPLSWAQKPRAQGFNVEIPEYQPGIVSEYAGSRTLSGGQWQRIALARAFMKIKEADLLILDEPSSALDPQAEYQVFKTIMDLRRDKTTIYIVCIPFTGLIKVASISYCSGSIEDFGTPFNLIY
jgi:ABC-type uncharacterized transport system ATPase subunit